MKNEIKQYYNNIAIEYDKNRFENTYGTYIDKQERQILQKLLKNNPKSHTLDIPCGTGRFSDFAAYGADISPNMLDIAEQKYPDNKFIETDALKTPFNDKQFQTILSFHFIMHLNKSETQLFINEAYRLLESGGRLIFDFPSKSRRRIVNYEATNWHAANNMDMAEIKLLNDNWILKSYRGILFLPIHRLPAKIRFIFRPIDTLLCRSFLRSYASYIIVEMQKK